jgi:hypothetical protein
MKSARQTEAQSRKPKSSDGAARCICPAKVLKDRRRDDQCAEDSIEVLPPRALPDG